MKCRDQAMVPHERERPHPNPPPEGEGTTTRPCAAAPRLLPITPHFHRAFFTEVLGSPWLELSSDCFLLGEAGELQGFSLLFPELPIGRAVIELVSGPGASASGERELLSATVEAGSSLGLQGGPRLPFARFAPADHPGRFRVQPGANLSGTGLGPPRPARRRLARRIQRTHVPGRRRGTADTDSERRLWQQLGFCPNTVE